MKKTRLIFISVVCATLAGCNSEVAKQPSTSPQPIQITTTSPTVATPKPESCDLIPDPVQAEDCRFTKKVQAEKKRRNVDPVVKHSPGSIQQP